MTSLTTHIDATTVDELRIRGSQKWADASGAFGAWVAEMDFGLAPEIDEALMDAHSHSRFGYPPMTLTRELTEAVSDFVGETTSWQPDPGQIVPVSTVVHALSLVIDHYTVPGSAVVLPTPAYMPFLDIPKVHDRELRQVPLVQDDHGWKLDLDALDRALDGAGLLIWVNPHNPLGKVYTEEETRAVIDIVSKHPGVRVFSDEIHAPVIYPGNRHVPYASVSRESTSQAITAISASKMWNLAGLKCAQIIFSNPDDTRLWVEKVRRLSAEPSTPGMIANIAAYRRGGVWRQEILEYLDQNRKLVARFVADNMPGVSMQVPDATYLAWLDCRSLNLGTTPKEFFQTRANVCLTDGELCGDAGKGFARLNFATPRPVLTKILELIAASVQRLPA